MRNDKFELVRYGLKKYNLIADGPSLEERRCEVEWGKGNCYNCMATHICAKRVIRHFYHQYKNNDKPWFKVQSPLSESP